ncbi:MAG: hypothetical protein QW744_01425 [Candidatus Bathyarchaeia archaeon]
MSKQQIKLLTPSFVVFVIGVTYQVLNAIFWGWWAIDLERNPIAPGAIFDGYTINQIVAMHLGWLAGSLFILSLLVVIIGLISIFKEKAGKET